MVAVQGMHKSQALSAKKQVFYLDVCPGLGLLKAMASVPAGGYGMDVTKKNKRDGTEVTERSKCVDFFSSELF